MELVINKIIGSQADVTLRERTRPLTPIKALVLPLYGN
jgi:hypothetical protein